MIRKLPSLHVNFSIFPTQKDIRVLNYAPGPMYTEMFDDIMNNSDSDGMRKMFADMKAEVDIYKFILTVHYRNFVCPRTLLKFVCPRTSRYASNYHYTSQSIAFSGQ